MSDLVVKRLEVCNEIFSLNHIDFRDKMMLRKALMTGVVCLQTCPGLPVVHREGGGADDSICDHHGYHRDIELAHSLCWIYHCIHRLSR